MTNALDLGNIALISNSIYNSISSNSSAITELTVTGNLVVSGTAAVVSFSTTPPPSPSNGTLWYDTENGIMYTYYSSSSAWVDHTSFQNDGTEDYTVLDGMGAGNSIIHLYLEGGSSVISNYKLATSIDSGASGTISSGTNIDGGQANDTFTIFEVSIDAGIAATV